MTNTRDNIASKKKFSFHLRRRLAALVPEHFGDVFFALLVIVMGIGAGFFWLLALLPSSEKPAENASANIPRFIDEELDDIIKILNARTEASTAPVVPPDRNPFK